jgi:hypothetical protein
MATVGFGLMFVVGAFAMVVAGATQGDPHQIMLCHATHSASNPFKSFSSDGASIVKGSGHGVHGSDIIPPFDFGPGLSYGGLNWTAEGQAIWNAGCAVPPPPTTAPPTTAAPLPPPPPPPTTASTTTTSTIPVAPVTAAAATPPPPPRPTTTTSTTTSTTTTTTTTTTVPPSTVQLRTAPTASVSGGQTPAYAFAGGLFFLGLTGLVFRRFS